MCSVYSTHFRALRRAKDKENVIVVNMMWCAFFVADEMIVYYKPIYNVGRFVFFFTRATFSPITWRWKSTQSSRRAWNTPTRSRQSHERVARESTLNLKWLKLNPKSLLQSTWSRLLSRRLPFPRLLFLSLVVRPLLSFAATKWKQGTVYSATCSSRTRSLRSFFSLIWLLCLFKII